MRTIIGIRNEYSSDGSVLTEAPTVWFDTWRHLVGVLSDENRQLLKTMSLAQPQTVAELAKLSGRAPSNLSRTLKKLKAHGLVRLHRVEGSRAIRPEAIATEFLVLLE